MRYLSWMIVAGVALWIVACGSQEQPPTTTAPPAVTAPPQVSPPTPAPEPAAPAAIPAEPDKPAATVTVPSPAPPASAPPAPAPPKPAVQSTGIPDVIVLQSKQGQINFPHQAHAKEYSCSLCHGDGTPGGIALPMDVAHSLCRDCHKAKGAGPTTCAGCHKK